MKLVSVQVYKKHENLSKDLAHNISVYSILLEFLPFFVRNENALNLNTVYLIWYKKGYCNNPALIRKIREKVRKSQDYNLRRYAMKSIRLQKKSNVKSIFTVTKT